MCPTDCLEVVINNTFQQEHYFYTSLGNSFNLNDETLNNLKCVVEKYHIRKICFVIANDNKIVNDALGNQEFSSISGLQKFYTDISKQKEQSKILWQNDNRKLSVLSYYLNNKIKKLQQELDEFCEFSITISGKVYNRSYDTFAVIYHDLVCLKKYQLN